MIHLSHNPQPKRMQVVIVLEMFSLAVSIERSVLLWSLHALQDVNIFQKDFLFVPIHDVLHWSLVIVCHPALLPEVAAASHSGEAQAAATTGWDRLPPAQAAAAAAQARATAAAAVATAGGGSQSRDEQLQERTESAGAATAAAAVTAATFARKPVILHLDSMSSKQPHASEQPLLLKRSAPAVLCQQAVQAAVWQQLHCRCILLQAEPPRFRAAPLLQKRSVPYCCRCCRFPPLRWTHQPCCGPGSGSVPGAGVGSYIWLPQSPAPRQQPAAAGAAEAHHGATD